MWIRSQSLLTLANFECLKIRQYGSKEFAIVGEGDIILGKYSTEKKAMKVMDMIEDRIRLSEMFKLHIYEPLNRTDQFMFQLPNDEDIEV